MVPSCQIRSAGSLLALRQSDSPASNTAQPCLTFWALSSQMPFRNKITERRKATSCSRPQALPCCHFIAFFDGNFTHSLQTKVILFFLPGHWQQLALLIQGRRGCNAHTSSTLHPSRRKSWMSSCGSQLAERRTTRGGSRSLLNYYDHSQPSASCRIPRCLSHHRSDGLLKYLLWANYKIAQTTVSFN